MASVDYFISLAKIIHTDLVSQNLPPDEGSPSYSQRIIYFSVVRGSRGYIEKLVHQINGTYENGWYDSCAVMIRRLIETLITECFEAHDCSAKIQNSSGDFLYLGDLIAATLNNTSWNIGRNTKKALKNLKDIGDKSAHSRRFIAQRLDIDNVADDLRIAVQELIYLAHLK
jgi:hypothetical protein